MQARGWLLVGLAVAALLLVVGRAATSLAVDHAWMSAMGVPELFWERVIDSTVLQGGAWVLGSVFAFANLHAVRRTILAVAVPSRVANIELTAMVPGRRLLAITIVLALAIGAAMAVPLTNWTDVAMVRHGLPFQEIEGIFDRDLGFYVYWLPLEETLYLWALVSVVTVTATVVILYALTRSLRMEGRRISASTHVRRHLTVLGSLVLLLLAWSYRLDGFDLLQYGSGPDGLFVRTDHRVTLRIDFVLSVGSAVAALAILRAGWAGQLRTAFLTLTLVLVAAVGLRHVVPAVLSRGQLLGDPAVRDADYVAMRALVSRRAFHVDGIRDVSDDGAAQAALRLDPSTLPRVVSLWDGAMIRRAAPVTRAQGAVRDGDPLVSLSTIVNESPDSTIGALLVRRPVFDSGAWTVTVADGTRPQWRETRAPGVLRSDTGAVDEPHVGPDITGHLLRAGNSPAQGVELRSTWRRVAHAWALRDPSLLRADTVRFGPPVLLTRRSVRDRIAQLAPVLVQGSEIAAISHEGRLFWAVSLYSASDRFPLSQHWQIAGSVFSYFRPAATAVVDAETGVVRLVEAAAPDPVVRTWRARLPTLFATPGELPTALLRQLPPATDHAIAQLRTFARYGSRRGGSLPRQLPDSAFVGGLPAPHAVFGANGPRAAWSIALIDAGDQIGGIATITGGADGGTWWDTTSAPRSRWKTLTTQLAAGLDSVRDSTANASGIAPPTQRSRAHALMTTRGVLLVQAEHSLRRDEEFRITHVGVTDGSQGVSARRLTRRYVASA